MVLAGCTSTAAASSDSCVGALGAPAFAAGPLKTIGTTPVAAGFALIPGHTYLIEVDEHDNDALAEVLNGPGELLVRVDHPVRRAGTQRAVVTAPRPGTLSVRIAGKEPQAVGSTVARVYDLAALQDRPDCLAIVKELAAADAEYATGLQISLGHVPSPDHSARDSFLRAEEGYAAAERALRHPDDQLLRGEAALALAGVEYFDLEDWDKAADWAVKAVQIIGAHDPYRRANAEALAGAAWLEIGAGGHSTELLLRARETFRRLKRFHTERGERYDAALQVTNIGLTYLYEGQYLQCAAASATASHLFDAIHDALHRAQAWQNRALCLWGLGRLPEALRWLERALPDIGPEPYPVIYVAAITNTALADFALGHFDDSLALYDRALVFSEKFQSKRDEAYSLYGIGLNYYALGDRQRAREFLERALAMRTVALDGRGRMATLRALATIDADEDKVESALAADREALGLAVAPSAIERIRIQLAVHTAATGRLEEATKALDDVLASGGGADPLIRAEALLQRATLLRQNGRLREALADLAIARPRLFRLGSVSEVFQADLERARTLRADAQPRAALQAVQRALEQSDAVRLQTVNPELRAQLQTPLRSAYDLKIELLRARYDAALAAGQSAQAQLLAAAAAATADAARAHSFADVAAQKYSPAVRQALAAEFRRREGLYRELAARRFALETRLDRSGSADPRATHLMNDIAELERKVDALNTVIATHAGALGGHVASSRNHTSLPPLPQGTVIISYWLGSESAYAWVISNNQIQWARLAAPATITERATELHSSLTRLIDLPVERRLQGSRAMYDLVISPINSWVEGVQQWVIIPDGALDYIPFAALSSAEGFVASHHDIASAPAVWMLSGRTAPRESPDPGRLLLVADPVYQPDDPRLPTFAKGHTPAESTPDPIRPRYQRLAYTSEEASRIRAEFPREEVDQLIGLDATRERLLALDWSRYRFIHIATHGVVDAQVPQLSALILGSFDASGRVVDGAVRVADLSLQTLKADVAVFSACETALGKQVPSEGLVGISSTVLARGARAVVASLWPVADEMGARLMTEFYRHLLHDAMSPPAALGAAMRGVLARDPKADPALWAAFQVSVVSLRPPDPLHAGVAELATTTKPWERP